VKYSSEMFLNWLLFFKNILTLKYFGRATLESRKFQKVDYFYSNALDKTVKINAYHNVHDFWSTFEKYNSIKYWLYYELLY